MNGETGGNLQSAHPRVVWLFFIRHLITLSIIPVGVTLFLISLIPAGSNLNLPLHRTILTAICANIALWFIVAYLWSWLIYRTYRFKLNDKIFQKETGILSKKCVIIPIENIQNIEVNRPLFSRLLGLSELQIETSSAHSLSDGRLLGIDKHDAENLKNSILKLTHAARINSR